MSELTITNSLVPVLDTQLRVQHLRVTDQEDQPVLVFLHEGLGAIALWKQFPQQLAKALQCNAIIYNRKGYGYSSGLELPRPLDYLEQEAAKDLPALLQALGIKKPILVGHSDGGSIALLYAAQFPTTAVVSIAAHAYVEDITIQSVKEVAHAYRQSPKLKQSLSKYHEDADGLFWAWVDTWLHPDFRAWSVLQQLTNIDAPCLLVQGEQDEYATQEHPKVISEYIPTAQVSMLPNCKHLPHIQAPAALLELVQSFLYQFL